MLKNYFTEEQLAKAKDLSYANWENEDSEIGFDYYSTWITNPFVDETGRVELTYTQMCNMYGVENVVVFIIDILKTKKVENMEERITMEAIIYKHGENDYGIWQLDLPQEVIDKIEVILDEYRHRGCSVRGTMEEILKEMM